MQIDGWQYYLHAAIPTTAPHEEPNMVPINDGSIWKVGESTPSFRKLLKKMSSTKIVGKLNALLQMEEIKRMKI